MSHPLRVRILAMLDERKASPNQLSGWLGASLGTVAYHVRTLEQLGLIELVDETRVRGAVEHHYRAKERPIVTADGWAQASPIAKQAAVGSSLDVIAEYSKASAAAGGFDRARRAAAARARAPRRQGVRRSSRRRATSCSSRRRRSRRPPPRGSPRTRTPTTSSRPGSACCCSRPSGCQATASAATAPARSRPAARRAAAGPPRRTADGPREGRPGDLGRSPPGRGGTEG